jgi:hypothetical protein
MDMWTLRATRDYENHNLEVVIRQEKYILFIETSEKYQPPVFSHVIDRSEASLEEAQEMLIKVVDYYLNVGYWIHSNDVHLL